MQNLKAMVDAQLAKTGEVINTYPWQDPYAYGMWLTQTYHIVNQSTRLLALAGACAPMQHQGFHNRLVDHSREERGHDKMTVMNLKALGFKVEDFPVLPQSLCLPQVQYYWIQHRHPVSFYGYVLALECLAESFGPFVTQKASEAHGPKAATFIKVHAEEDIDHTKSTWDEIANFSAAECELVAENFALSAQLYRSMLVEAQAQSAQMKKTRAA